ncbi:MAG: sigma-70 family RNA polymerase sigma factor [Gemmatimonadales bacterium]
MTEQDDLTAAQAGDHAAFERIVRRHAARVHALARWAGGGDDADERTQDVFVLLWRKIGLYDGRSAFSTWLHRLAINEINSAHRSNRRLERNRDGHRHTEPPGQTSAADRVELEDAITRLPAELRQVFGLHDVEGYRHEEIGGMLGIPPGTSASRLHRARHLLREALSETK